MSLFAGEIAGEECHKFECHVYVMTSRRILYLLLLVSASACSTETKKNKVDPRAIDYNYRITSLVQAIDNMDSCRKAISLLDSATSIDSSCFLCYYNKLMFYAKLKEYDKGIETINILIRRNPNAYDLYITASSFYK